MPADLVVANAAYTTYPGGVIALRCTDWLGPARGTLSTETDTRAIAGQVVRDTQVVTNSIRAAPVTAFAEAEDTLVVDFAALPVEPDMTYKVLVSHLIEGDWDPTNTDTHRNTDQGHFLTACNFAFYGDSTLFPIESDFGSILYMRRFLESYIIGEITGAWNIGDVVGNEVLHFRAYAQDDTTIEWLLDQIFLVPIVRDGGTHGQWENIDFAIIGGAANTFGFIDITNGDFVDGSDGGDINGEFTWHAFQAAANQQSSWSGADGGGDYQKKDEWADAEYMLRVVEEDGYTLESSQTGVEASAHAYAAAGPEYQPAVVFVDDEFTRTLNWPVPTEAGSDWGATPEGFGWSTSITGSGTQYTAVDGTRGVHFVGGTIGGNALVQTDLGSGAVVTRARLRLEDFDVSFTLEIQNNGQAAGAADAEVSFETRPASGNVIDRIVFDVGTQTWWLEAPAPAAASTILYGPIDISGFFHTGIGVRMKTERYRIRVRVWDTSGAEPGTWDYDDFRVFRIGATLYTYPYGGDLSITQTINQAMHFRCASSHANAVASWSTWWDDFVVDYDPVGDREDVSIAAERPEGTNVGEIVIPDGAQQLVYFGERDWTDVDPFGDVVIVMSARIWSALDAAFLQQARLLWFYFRSGRAGIIPMNWRSSERPGSVWRVLVGHR